MAKDHQQQLLAFALVANVSDDDHGGVTSGIVYQGTRMLAPGKRVYLGQPYWGGGADSIHVVGMRRTSKDFVNCVTRSSYLTNLRLATIYSPTLIAKLQKLGAELYVSRASAELAMLPLKRVLLHHLEHDALRAVKNN